MALVTNTMSISQGRIDMPDAAMPRKIADRFRYVLVIQRACGFTHSTKIELMGG
ncbi:UNVERIFIED_CONTAM: hypothetical protein Sangu_2655800 [Sesamum angustifolium]|uniref:Uncharacterized protein n=1 Tax=Sesamum angustifolium TaxID=2727405 RepID=A0AAW2J1U7_9LAMI